MLTVKSLLDIKGRSVWSVARETTVIDALHMMADKDVGALLVVENEKPVGILSERDIVRRLAESENCNLNMPVRELMTSPVFFVGQDYTLDECMALMTNKRIRHLPVVEQGKLIGLVSIGDVVKAQIQDKDLLINHLENYITGTGYGH